MLTNNQLTGSIPAAAWQPDEPLVSTSGQQPAYGEHTVSLTNLTTVDYDGIDLRWNALYTTDNTLRTFLNSKQTGGQLGKHSDHCPNQPNCYSAFETSVQLTWTPIAYTGDTGGYEVYYSTDFRRALHPLHDHGDKKRYDSYRDWLNPGDPIFLQSPNGDKSSRQQPEHCL